MNKDPTKFKNIRKQINVMQNISHPNIIKLYESVDTLTKISLVTQYGGNESLLEYLKRKYPLAIDDIRSIAKQLLEAIQYLHERNIVHRDIKLHNILMHDGTLKLIDFGFSTISIYVVMQLIVTVNLMLSVGHLTSWLLNSLVKNSISVNRLIYGHLEL